MLPPLQIENFLRRTLAACAVLVALSGCDGGSDLTGPTNANVSPSGYAMASAGVAATGDLVDYATLSDEDLWAYVERSGGRVDIGLKGPDMATGFADGVILVDGVTRLAAKAAALAVPGVELTYEDDLFPLIGLSLPGVGALAALRALPVVDYVEPAALFAPEGAEGIWMSSCGTDSYNGSLYTAAAGDKLSPRMGVDIEAAWARSDGAGVTISFVGTGVSQYQPQLNADFVGGQSTGRTITRDYEEPSPAPNQPWHDDCVHETKLIGNAAAPLDGQGIAGIAHRANIFSVRTDNDTHLSEDSYNVQLGIRKAAQAGRVVAMAFGSPATKTNISNEIQYWYNHQDYTGSLERVFVGAAGSTNFATNHVVYFPASMTQVIAVTGTDPDDGACDGFCHYDQDVEFGLPTNEPTLSGANSYGIVNGGGSSHSVGTFAAMVALVASEYPSYDRAQIKTRLETASPYHPSLGGGGRRTDTGWATPMLNCALGGLCAAELDGGSNANYAQGGTQFTFSSQILGNAVPVNYTWVPPDGAYVVGSHNQASVTFQAYPTSARVESAVVLYVTDQVSGRQLRLERPFAIGPDEQDCPPGATCGIGEG